MAELVERLVTWQLHPADLVTYGFALEHVDRAYSLTASGRCGKVAVCFDRELVKQSNTITGQIRGHILGSSKSLGWIW